METYSKQKLQPEGNNKKFLFLISLPDTKEFLSERNFVNESISKLQDLGADVIERMDAEVMTWITDYDYVIVIAHHDEATNSLVLSDRIVPISEFVEWIPEDFAGVLDFSSCYSSNAMARIKERTQNRCKVQAAVRQTALALRLIMYPYIVKLLSSDEKLDYDEAYSRVLDLVSLGFSQSKNNESESCEKRAVKLGEGMSTIYAPSEVRKAQTFLINIFFHTDVQTGEVALMAQRLDPTTSLVDTQILPLELNFKDTLTARLTVNNGDSRGINVNCGADTKSIRWMKRPARIQFPVTVKEEYTGDSIVCEIKLEVNSEPAGECLFTINIAEKESQIPCEISLTPSDKEAEREDAKNYVKTQIKKNLQELENAMQNATSDKERETLKTQYNVGLKCLEIVENAKIRQRNPDVLKVFISSASDMEPYRDIVKKEISDSEMVAKDYRYWHQSEKKPCDVCCQNVLEADVILCLIGSRYGYEEPSIGLSMTQMEFWTGLMAGKKILAFIIEPLEDSKEKEDYKKKQKDFIQELKQKRILKIFSDNLTLIKETIRELSYLKK